MRGKHVFKCSSSTQTIQGLSGGESEFMALVCGGTTGLGAKAIGQKFGLDLETDLLAAKGVAWLKAISCSQSTLLSRVLRFSVCSCQVL